MKEKAGLHIQLASERLFELWGIPITNTLLSSWLVIITLLVVAFFVGRKPNLLPKAAQNFFEILFEYVLNFMQQTLGTRELAIKYVPLIATIFLFIVTANLYDFLPFFGSVGIMHEGELVPLLHAANTDLNTTLALAIISVISIEVAGIMTLGVFKYGSKFFNFSSVLGFVVGLIEFVSEMSRFVSFSFRLFGNIFAGQVLLGVIALFVPYIVPVPLMAFELFVGVVQAAVFSMLTLFFIKMAIAEPHDYSGKKARASH